MMHYMYRRYVNLKPEFPSVTCCVADTDLLSIIKHMQVIQDLDKTFEIFSAQDFGHRDLYTFFELHIHRQSNPIDLRHVFGSERQRWRQTCVVLLSPSMEITSGKVCVDREVCVFNACSRVVRLIRQSCGYM